MDLIFLHGAISSRKQFNFLLPYFGEGYTIHTLDFFGHGGSPPVDSFSIPLFANQVLEYIDQNSPEDENGTRCVNIFGYSMGGYVAMYLARHYGERVGKILTLATKFYWDEEVATREVKMLNPDIIEAKIPAFAKKLADDHQPEDWKLVLNKTADMLTRMGSENPLSLHDFAAIQNDCLLMLGDRDKMVSLAETTAIYNQVPKAQLCVMPGTEHRLEDADPEILSYLIKRFL